MQTFFGATVDCDLADLVTMCIFHFGVWEPHISALIASRLRDGDVFCDIGANIGYHSLLASYLVGDSGRVVAIEPSPAIFQRMTSNLRRNRANNVRPVKAAVTATAGSVSLYRGSESNTSMATTIRDYGFGKECDVTGFPLKDILLPGERTNLRLIKIDVEGGELAILNELINTIGDYSPELELLVELSEDNVRHNGDAVSAIFEQFSGLGFLARSVPNSYDRLTDYLAFQGIKSPVNTQLPLQGQQDVLFSRSFGSAMGGM